MNLPIYLILLIVISQILLTTNVHVNFKRIVGGLPFLMLLLVQRTFTAWYIYNKRKLRLFERVPGTTGECYVLHSRSKIRKFPVYRYVE